MKARNNDCVLRTKTEVNGCAALVDVHPDCGPECPFYKNKKMEMESRRKAEDRLKHTKIFFVDKLPAGWDS